MLPRAPESLVAPETLRSLLALAQETPPGAFLEVGVYQGGSAWHLARLAQEQGRECYLFDTFTGIPCRGPRDSHQIGDFADTSIERVREAIPYARVQQCVFPHRVDLSVPVAFAHLDVDQEECYRESIAFLLTRMIPGGVLWFDDAPCLAGAKHAVLERFANPNESQGKYWVRV